MNGPSLPIQLTSLLGREQETATLQQTLRYPATRLLTITGPGGVGKTSLALQVGHKLTDAFKDGVYFVSLAPISDSTLIIPTIAQALGIAESPNRLLLDSLKDFLRNKQTLLLLDNFEQIVSAAPILTELLEACAELRMLVTSREALRVRGENEFPLAPLALSDQLSIESLYQSPGIALFVERVQAVQPDFQLTEENAPAVTEICVRLDGLPLAIELAAARIKLLPPKAMLKRLQESSLHLLTSGARDMPARQQTLRSVIQWSYDLLEEEEKHTFRWLAVFVGGCTLEAAQSVIGSPALLDVLESLVGKSLVRQTEIDGAPRLTMLETIREFGWEQLTSTRELDSARRTHADFYLSFVEAAEQELTGADQNTWLQRLDRDQDNLRAALRWAIEHHEGELAQRMAGAMQPFWLARGYWSEGRRWLDALRLTQGFDNLTVKSDRALWQLSRAARSMPEVRAILSGQAAGEVMPALEKSSASKQFLADLRAWLAQYGQRLNSVFTLNEPSWIEDPTPAIQNMQAYITLPDRPPEVETAATVEREKAVAEARAILAGYPKPIVDRFETLLKAAQIATVVHEDHNVWIDQRFFYHIRRIIMEFGARLAQAGILEIADEVFYLTPKELQNSRDTSMKKLVQDRKEEMEHFGQVTPPPMLGTAPPFEMTDAGSMVRALFKGEMSQPNDSQPAANMVKGLAGSAGVTRGTARALHSLTEASKLQPGDILVTPSTEPPWTPLFATASAVVTDYGGVLSHTAVVAREYRIPAVVGTGLATSTFHDGQLIEVDGNAGIVRVVIEENGHEPALVG